MSNKRARGRPVGPSTIERRRVEELLRSPLPAHLPRMTAAEQAKVEDSIAAGERVRKQILKDYRHGATTPNAHAYEMASLGDESMEGYEGEVLGRDRDYKAIADAARRRSADDKRKTADKQAAVVCEHFRTLLSQVVPLGRLSRSAVAIRMKANWPTDGSLGLAPSDRTLREWITRGSPFPEHKVGSVSLRKKS